MNKNIKIVLIILGLIFIFVIITAIIAVSLGYSLGYNFESKTFVGFGKKATPGVGDVCYGINLKILDCFYSTIAKKAIVDIKINSGSVDGFQGIISGKIDENIAGSNKDIEVKLGAGESKKIEFQFEKTIDGDSLDNLQAPLISIRPIIDETACIQFYQKSCKQQ